MLAPRLYARNRFFELFRDERFARIRARATVLRGIVRQLVGRPGRRPQIVGEQVLVDDRVLLRYEIPELDFVRTVALAPLEAALVRYALYRAGVMGPDPEATHRIEAALAKMSAELPRYRFEPEPSPR